MRRIPFAIAGLTLLCALQSRSELPADFSGVWEMDRSRSASALQGERIGPVTLVIRQQPSALTIETRRKNTETLRFNLDGTGTVNTVAGGVEVKTKARWDGPRLVAETVRNLHGSTVTTTQVYSLEDGGKELVVDKSLTVQHGYQFPGAQNTGSGRDFFKRKGPAR